MIVEDLTETKDGGIVKQIIVQGKDDRKPRIGDKVIINYVCKISNGSESSYNLNKYDKFAFAIGADEVIKGLDIGVKSMKKGEKCSLVIQPKYAHGSTGFVAKTLANTTLELQVELLSWKNELSKGINGLRLISGTGYSSPKDGNIIEVHIQTIYKGKVVEERNIIFELGKGTDSKIVPGVELALKSFKKGEKTLLKVASKYAYASDGCAELNIPPNADIEFQVTLHNFEKNKKSWEYEADEKIVQANFCKIKGTNNFTAGNYPLAANQYEEMITFLESEMQTKQETQNEIRQLFLTGLLNLSMCFLKMGKYVEALTYCNKALHVEANNIKGLYRRGMAHLGLKSYDMAEKDFECVLKVDQNNKAATSQLAICKNKLKEQRDKDKQAYANMFQKFAEDDAKVCAQ